MQNRNTMWFLSDMIHTPHAIMQILCSNTVVWYPFSIFLIFGIFLKENLHTQLNGIASIVILGWYLYLFHFISLHHWIKQYMCCNYQMHQIHHEIFLPIQTLQRIDQQGYYLYNWEGCHVIRNDRNHLGVKQKQSRHKLQFSFYWLFVPWLKNW